MYWFEGKFGNLFDPKELADPARINMFIYWFELIVVHGLNDMIPLLTVGLVPKAVGAFV